MRIHNLVKLLYENSAQKLLFKAKLKVKKKDDRRWSLHKFKNSYSNAVKFLLISLRLLYYY